MKKLLFICFAIALVSSCKNQDITFDDYDTQTIYFPIQYPVRAISLGNDLVDNSLDKQHKFHIGVCVGGYYSENKRDWTVNFIVDTTLVRAGHLKNAKGDIIKILPPSYYTLTPGTSVVIPKGSFNGLVEVQLTDAFFQDSLAVTGSYVIPLRITDSPDTENILHGTPNAGAPTPTDPHVQSYWSETPMDYTLFGVKYVNPYHGNWLRRGALTVRNSVGHVDSVVKYHGKYVENNEAVMLTTKNLHTVLSTMSIGSEQLKLKLVVDDNGKIVVTSQPAAPIAVTYGTGSYKERAEAWGGTPENPTKRDVIYMNYYYTRVVGANTYNCEVNDTLVFRDRAIVYEASRPTVVTP